MRRWINRYGRAFAINVPIFGHCVVVSDPALVRSVCGASTDELKNVTPNLSNWFGPGSTFGLDGAHHRARRRLIAAAVHGRRLNSCEQVIEEETRREIANWPEGQEFRTYEPMNRITLNVILRTVLGADGAELEELAQMIPPHMRLGQLLAFLPAPPPWLRRHGPWRKLGDFREAFDRMVLTLIEQARADPGLGDRGDILALMVRAQVPPLQCCDELMTFIGAGHETTATALSWGFERLRRHPDVLAELVREVDEGGGELRRAAISELLRVRTVIDVLGRRVSAPDFELGRWRVPQHHTVLVRIADLHGNPEIYPRPERFDPYRFVGSRPEPSTWLPFGGGARRCIGAEFAIAEMDIVIRTVLQVFEIQTDETPGEKSHFRGIAHVPKRGGRVVVHRRRLPCRPS